MNKLTIIGNVCADPEARTTATGVPVTTFTVAVNRRCGKANEKATDYFRVSAWRSLGDSCGKYLSKGKKVCVVGEVSTRLYTAKDGNPRASLEVNATDVEFLSPRDADKPEDLMNAYDREQLAAARAYAEDAEIEITEGDLPF